ncbi:MAG: class I SAM-dependent methyltransferase [Sphingobacteriaceae bacterium]|nr:class I SAM-dependent methyltransferase [Cytophagaceae bacterium]
MPDVSQKDAVYYERLYQTHADPWSYAEAAEQAKYRITLEAARRWQPHPERVLEVACSLGYLTHQLAGYAPNVYAFDVSETAVAQTRERCRSLDTPTQFDIRVGDAIEPDYPQGFFDVIFLEDVLLEITEEATVRARILRNTLRLLRPGGVVILTDYQQPSHQAVYVAEAQSQGRIVEKLYFHDRYWFRLRGFLKALRRTALAKALLRSETVYRALARLGAGKGPEGSKHFGLIIQPLS